MVGEVHFLLIWKLFLFKRFLRELKAGYSIMNATFHPQSFCFVWKTVILPYAVKKIDKFELSWRPVHLL